MTVSMKFFRATKSCCFSHRFGPPPGNGINGGTWSHHTQQVGSGSKTAKCLFQPSCPPFFLVTEAQFLAGHSANQKKTHSPNSLSQVLACRVCVEVTSGRLLTEGWLSWEASLSFCLCLHFACDGWSLSSHQGSCDHLRTDGVHQDVGAEAGSLVVSRKHCISPGLLVSRFFHLREKQAFVKSLLVCL